jgi:hypothetical protein
MRAIYEQKVCFSGVYAYEKVWKNNRVILSFFLFTGFKFVFKHSNFYYLLFATSLLFIRTPFTYSYFK